jgi:hypothetical protein
MNVADELESPQTESDGAGRMPCLARSPRLGAMHVLASQHDRRGQILASNARALRLFLLAHRGAMKLFLGRTLADLHKATTCLVLWDVDERPHLLNIVDATLASSNRRLDDIEKFLKEFGPNATYNA